MGMFDRLSCAMPLPDGYVAADGEFQTKDLSCELNDYAITEDGIFRTANGDDAYIRLNFYDMEPDTRVWHEYNAVCEVKVLRIEQVPDRQP